jgi:hypothetical protein
MDTLQNFQFLPFSIILFPASRQTISSYWLLIYLYTVTTGSGEFLFTNTGYDRMKSTTRLRLLTYQINRLEFSLILSHNLGYSHMITSNIFSRSIKKTPDTPGGFGFYLRLRRCVESQNTIQPIIPIRAENPVVKRLSLSEFSTFCFSFFHVKNQGYSAISTTNS